MASWGLWLPALHPTRQFPLTGRHGKELTTEFAVFAFQTLPHRCAGVVPDAVPYSGRDSGTGGLHTGSICSEALGTDAGSQRPGSGKDAASVLAHGFRQV